MGAMVALASEPIIRTEGLTKRYGTFTAVDQLDLEVRPGEIYGLLGPNGAGKTTTILMLLGLSEPSAGRAQVAGLDPVRQPLEVKRRVGYLPDNAGFYGGLSGRANLRYTARLNGLRGAAVEERIETVLAQVGLTDAADGRVETYSRGMRQRLGIADALIKEPELLILDEPTIAIDPAGVSEILALIRRLVDERGIALLLSSHLLEQVQSVCDRVGIFIAGRLVAEGRVDELARRVGGGPLAIEVGVEPAEDSVEAVLHGIPGATEVRRDRSDPRHWVVAGDETTLAAIPRTVDAAGFRLVHLRRRDESLDAIYRRIVGADGEQPGSPGGTSLGPVGGREIGRGSGQ